MRDNHDVYIVVRCDSLIKLIDKVNKKSSQGLIPIGSLIVHENLFYQPMMITRRYANQLKEHQDMKYKQICTKLRNDFALLNISEKHHENFESHMIDATHLHLLIKKEITELSDLHLILNIGELV